MVQIITDSSSLYNAEDAKKLGVISIPLSVTIGGKELRDLSTPIEAFIAQIQAGQLPASSQPPIGDVIDAFERCKGMKIINLSMADGLSGTYQTACSAREIAENREDITVINTRTLCGPHRYLVECAAAMAREGQDGETILRMVEEKMASTRSYLIPQDFAFLQRGGRLSPTVAWIGSLLNIKPIVVLNREGTRLDKFGTGRTLKGAVKAVFKQMQKDHVGKEDILYIAHGAVPEDAAQIKEMALKEFPGIDVRIHELSHVFITQGGPGCVALQHIHR